MLPKTKWAARDRDGPSCVRYPQTDAGQEAKPRGTGGKGNHKLSLGGGSGVGWGGLLSALYHALFFLPQGISFSPGRFSSTQLWFSPSPQDAFPVLSCGLLSLCPYRCFLRFSWAACREAQGSLGCVHRKRSQHRLYQTAVGPWWLISALGVSVSLVQAGAGGPRSPISAARRLKHI